MSDRDMTLHETMLGGGEEAYRIARMLEGLMMAQVALAVARFRVPDLLAAGPRTAGDIAQAVDADADALHGCWPRRRCTSSSAGTTPAGTR